MYELVLIATSVLVYSVILISPFVRFLRELVINWDEYESVGDGIFDTYYYIDYLKNGSRMIRWSSVKDITDGEFIVKYLLGHILLGFLLAAVVSMLWPLLFLAMLLIFIIKRVLKSIKNKNKTK